MIETTIRAPNNEKIHAYVHERDCDTAIILCHGFTGNSSGPFMPRIAERLSRSHLVCRFDFRGQKESEGAFYYSSITRELEDLDAIVRFIRTTYSPKKTFLIGHSFGAAIALLYAAPHLVEGLICLSGEGDLEDAISLEFSAEQLKELDEKGETHVVDWSLGGNPNLLGRKFLDDMKAHSTLRAAKELSIPALYVHGTQDEVIPHFASEKLASLTKHARLVLIDKADHLYNVLAGEIEQFNQMMDAVEAWLGKQ